MFSDKELPKYPFSDLEQQKHDPGRRKLFPNFPEPNIYNKSFDSVPFGPKGLPDHSRNPINPLVESDGLWGTFDRFTAGLGALPLPVKLHSINPEPHWPPVNEEWKGRHSGLSSSLRVEKVLDFIL